MFCFRFFFFVLVVQTGRFLVYRNKIVFVSIHLTGTGIMRVKEEKKNKGNSTFLSLPE